MMTLPEIEEIISVELSYINETTLAAISEALANMINEGDTVANMQQAIIDTGVFSAERALTIARTISGTALSYGQISAANAAGATHKTWHDSGFNTRAEHVARNGEKRKIDERFSVQFPGSTGPLYPCDQAATAADRINCRCAMSFLKES